MEMYKSEAFFMKKLSEYYFCGQSEAAFIIHLKLFSGDFPTGPCSYLAACVLYSARPRGGREDGGIRWESRFYGA